MLLRSQFNRFFLSTVLAVGALSLGYVGVAAAGQTVGTSANADTYTKYGYSYYDRYASNYDKMTANINYSHVSDYTAPQHKSDPQSSAPLAALIRGSKGNNQQN